MYNLQKKKKRNIPAAAYLDDLDEVFLLTSLSEFLHHALPLVVIEQSLLLLAADFGDGLLLKCTKLPSLFLLRANAHLLSGVDEAETVVGEGSEELVLVADRDEQVLGADLDVVDEIGLVVASHVHGHDRRRQLLFLIVRLAL